MDKNAKKRKSVNRAIERLAALLENGQLLAATDPAEMLDAASDKIETLEKKMSEIRESAVDAVNNDCDDCAKCRETLWTIDNG